MRLHLLPTDVRAEMLETAEERERKERASCLIRLGSPEGYIDKNGNVKIRRKAILDWRVRR